ncbi:LGFP repeat-containing protein [Rhodococcus rhodnii]|uniref:LGFP repeat-containing protein n=1 Tax=Rhodococcus rhodnii TaxID=38312 RepID=UPI00353111D0
MGGTFNHFEQGSIYRSPATGANVVWGNIRDKWFQIGAETNIGFPTAVERSLSSYSGRLQTFERASIHWTPHTGAHIVGGEIGNTWGAQNGRMETTAIQSPMNSTFPEVGVRYSRVARSTTTGTSGPSAKSRCRHSGGRISSPKSSWQSAAITGTQPTTTSSANGTPATTGRGTRKEVTANDRTLRSTSISHAPEPRLLAPRST